MFATLVAEMKAQSAELKSQEADREAFRLEMRTRLIRGAERMAAQDAILAEIKTQTLKTNGRVTKLEQGWKILCAKAIGAVAALTIVVKILLWAHEAKLIP